MIRLLSEKTRYATGRGILSPGEVRFLSSHGKEPMLVALFINHFRRYNNPNCERIVNHLLTYISEYVNIEIRNMDDELLTYYDGRNEETCRLCNILWEKIKERYHIENDTDKVYLPFI